MSGSITQFIEQEETEEKESECFSVNSVPSCSIFFDLREVAIAQDRSRRAPTGRLDPADLW